MPFLFLILFCMLMPRAEAREEVEMSTQLSQAPAGITITPKGETIVSLHQYFNPIDKVIKIDKKGNITPFPNLEMNRNEPNSGLTLNSVQGIECGKNGIVWMLDNGRSKEAMPKLVGWDTKSNALFKVIYLAPPASIPNSFMADLAVSPDSKFIFISDPALGRDAALITIDIESGISRRLLQGHFSVQPQPRLELTIDKRTIEARGIDGRTIQPQAGVNPIATDKKGEWLYFGPMVGRTLYRIKTSALNNTKLSPIELESRVQGYSEKPICDGISIDGKNNIYISDLRAKAVGVIDHKTRQYSLYCGSPKLDWIDGFCYGTDRRFHGYSSQIHKSAPYNQGKDVSKSPYVLFRFRGLSSGAVGR